MAPFLAMADLERARVCSFGLTKTFSNFNQFPQLRNLNYITKRVASIFLPARVGYFLVASFISFMRLRKAFSALPALGMPRERACLKVRSACL